MPKTCAAPIASFRDGKAAGDVCDPAAQGLTVIDLSDDYAPRVLAGGGKFGPVPYRKRYLRVARADIPDDDTWYRARHDRYHELYGVFPTPSLVASRLLDEQRHKCHDAVSPDGLAALDEGVDTWRPLAKQRGDIAWRKSLTSKMELAVRQLNISRIDELESHPQYGPFYVQWRKLTIRHAATRAMQQHLRCDGLLDDKERDGLMDSATINGMQAYMRRHMVINWQLGPETKDILMTDSRELDFRQLLRSLRERVVDATGLIEDGTAIDTRGKVVGRIIDTATLVDEHDGVVIEGGAPDLVAAATDAAARHLGWTDPASAAAFFRGDVPARVALPLPKPPAYHSDHMDLFVRIDRGDVWYDFPYLPNGDRELQPRDRKPTVVVYAKDGKREIPLVRWPTTIGSWQPETVASGQVKLVYKESPAGHRIYRDIVAAPRWIPPRSTPTRDLMRPKLHGEWAPKFDTFGPSYASAYGMVMLIHHRVDEHPDGTITHTDQGIRTHGSVSYASIMDGYSHGCHRLHNHRAVRLAGFMLAHRKYQVGGPIALDFHRTLYFRSKKYPLHFASRGFRYELTPPVDVEVLSGNIRGYAKSPRPPASLTRPMLKRYY